MDTTFQQQRYNELADKILKGNITPEELAEYNRWLQSEEEDLEIPGAYAVSETEHKNRLFQQIQQRKAPAINVLRTWRVAAAILLIVGAATFGLLFFSNNKSNLVAVEQPFKNDINPARGGVTLTLSTGSRLLLDTLQNGELHLEGFSAVKEENLLQYALSNNKEVIYNQVATSKGKTYRLRLSDGTSVWLDAQSSIRFPSNFSGNERVVEITGQVYFEVAKNPRQPFSVRSNGQTIQVLGTSFNVNAYDKMIATTLVEGSIKVNNTILQPNQQTLLQNEKIKVRADVDMTEVLAWKAGLFKFNGNSLEDIMRQLERWYDIEVIYKDQIPEMQLVAKIDRNMPISKILDLLEMTGQVSFSIEENKIIISYAINK